MPLTTEQVNPASTDLDRMDTLEMVQMMNSEDAKVVAAVSACTNAIASAIDLIAESLDQDGRLIYMGAGTSGRLGVLDASECPPTFNTRPEQVVGLIAGGDFALRNAVEGAEDSKEQGALDLRDVAVGPKDVVAGIAASGTTPYVLGGLEYAAKQGANTLAITCNAGSPVGALADIDIALIVGPEVLAGSTRLKSGSATKMVLNMLTTGAMVRIGKTYGNLMVDLRASNAKLKLRAMRIVAAVTDLPESAVTQLLQDSDGEVKTAIVCHKLGVSVQEGRKLLHEHKGHLTSLLSRLE